MLGIRVDANEKIATGHLMRCMSIAEMCRKLGQEILFILAEEKETGRLEKQGFPFHILHTDWAKMEEEIRALKHLVKEKKVQYLLVDSYQAGTEYLRQMNDLVPVMYIDDFGEMCYPVSAVLHYGISPVRDGYVEAYEKQGTKVLLGMEYIPLREEFMKEKNKAGERKKSILITTGGTDPFQITGQLLESCQNLKREDGTFVFEGFEYEVIAGAMNAHLDQLKAFSDKYPKIHIHHNVSNMSDYMRTCKMAVSAGGTTLYELCACGIPAVCFSFADNQKPGTLAFGKKKWIEYAGDARETDVVAGIVKTLRKFLEEPEFYKKQQRTMQEIVDGKGALRIAESIVGGL